MLMHALCQSYEMQRTDDGSIRGTLKKMTTKKKVCGEAHLSEHQPWFRMCFTLLHIYINSCSNP